MRTEEIILRVIEHNIKKSHDYIKIYERQKIDDNSIPELEIEKKETNDYENGRRHGLNDIKAFIKDYLMEQKP